jgi:hypothetical protein
MITKFSLDNWQDIYIQLAIHTCHDALNKLDELLYFTLARPGPSIQRIIESPAGLWFVLTLSLYVALHIVQQIARMEKPAEKVTLRSSGSNRNTACCTLSSSVHVLDRGSSLARWSWFCVRLNFVSYIEEHTRTVTEKKELGKKQVTDGDVVLASRWSQHRKS